MNQDIAKKQEIQKMNGWGYAYRRPDELQYIQALSNKRLTQCLIKTQFNGELIFTCPNAIETNCTYIAWYLKQDSIIDNDKYLKYRVVLENLSHESSCQKLHKEIKMQEAQNNDQENKSIKGNSLYGSTHQEDNIQEELYTQDDIAQLKKKLQFQSKGLLSKSAEFNTVKDTIIRIRFKCKQFQQNNICPFLHFLEYKTTIDGEPRYIHQPICSQHLPQCQLDDQDMQENVTSRKIDASMGLLENIIKENPKIKPKDILEKLAEVLDQEDQNFIYRGLKEKNNRRSIKKYFDNAVAKVKNQIKIQSK